MGREFAKAASTFWTGTTGRQLRGDADAQRVAFYLFTAPTANMIGLYYLPLPTLCHEVGIPSEGASKALRRVQEVGFAAYDSASEWVWVFEMARWQVGEKLKPLDNLVKHVKTLFEQGSKSPFAKDFWNKYHRAYHLPEMPKNTRGLQGAPKGSRARARVEREREREMEREKERETEREMEGSSATAPPAAKPDSVVLAYPCCGNGPHVWNLTESKLAEYREAFPNIDHLHEARKALQWVRDNSLKTYRGMGAYLGRWFGKAQDECRKAGGANGTHDPRGNLAAREQFLAGVETTDG